MLFLIYTGLMDENTDKSKLEKAEKRLMRAAFALFVILICTAVVILRAAGILKPFRPPRPFSAGRPVRTAKPIPSPEEPAEETPQAEASPEIVPTGEPQKYVKTSVIIDGETKATLASRQAAEETVRNAVIHFENLCMTSGISSNLKNSIKFADAPLCAETISYDEAYALFTGPDSPLTVESRVSFTEVESIAHETEEINSKALYTGTRMVLSYGRNGKNLRVLEYIYINGVLKETSELETRTLYAPVSEVIAVGIAEIPEGEAPDPEFGKADCPYTELKFNFPVRGEAVKFFGFYNGIMNNGIDFAAEKGAACGASCAGKVLSVMERGNRGMVVDLLHKGGFITRYAGLSSVNVNVGDIAGSGELLGIVGSKGLHFEILCESRPRNPGIYLLGLLEKPEV